MQKKRVKQNACPSCGETAEEPYKTWELVAPFPDKKMRITVTIFGMFKCPSCGRSFRGGRWQGKNRNRMYRGLTAFDKAVAREGALHIPSFCIVKR